MTVDRAFDRVIAGCANTPRRQDQGTWIVEDMIAAYGELHESGFAHSVETWLEGELVGGLYGVSLGRCFFGESMFAVRSNASKVALVRLVAHLHRHHFSMIDCQVTTDHLIRFGAREVPRAVFMEQLREALEYPTLRDRGILIRDRTFFCRQHP